MIRRMAAGLAAGLAALLSRFGPPEADQARAVHRRVRRKSRLARAARLARFRARVRGRKRLRITPAKVTAWRKGRWYALALAA